MKVIKLLILSSILSLNTVFAQEKKENDFSFPTLEGPYMGQKPPGLVAETFAPGIISKGGWEVEGVFAPGMKEFYFTLDRGQHPSSSDSSFQPIVIGFRQVKNVWEKYIEFPRTGEIAFSPDGKRMHMAKGYKDRIGDGWSELKSLDTPFKDMSIMRLSASSNGTYYFDTMGKDPIRYSLLTDGKRDEPKTLNIDLGKHNAHPFIAPDESYLIWDDQRESGYGGADIYISFRKKDGSWGPAINMGDKVNSEKSDSFASVTPDGKYMFFNRSINSKNYNTDIYWVDAQIIETLRPK